MASPKLSALPLPADITSGHVDCTSSCGLNFHVLKAGRPGQPLILFCHGFPEMAYSWRKVLPAVAAAGYYCVAMDQRGFGRTTGWDAKNLSHFTLTNMVRDAICLVYKLGYTDVACIVGHDLGAVTSSMAGLMRPDIFHSTIQMSHPLNVPPAPPLGDEAPKAKYDIQAELAKLDPPRKHYKYYNTTDQASHDWDNPEQGTEAFLRGYFYLKSADWPENKPFTLKAWSATDIAVMPEYYVMQKQHTMPQTVAHNITPDDPIDRVDKWLSPEDLQIYSNEWRRTGFEGALNWYRALISSTPYSSKDMLLFAGRKVQVPCAFISGKQDWGNYQQPNALQTYDKEKVVQKGCYRGATIVDDAGHWIQQEQPQASIDGILGFLKTL